MGVNCRWFRSSWQLAILCFAWFSLWAYDSYIWTVFVSIMRAQLTGRRRDGMVLYLIARVLEIL